MKFAIYSYNGAGASMKYLSHYLDDAPILSRHSALDLSNTILINYGASYLTIPWNSSWFNEPRKINNAVYKLRSFALFADHGIPFPRLTQDCRVAQDWLQQGKTIFARQTASGAEGEGIIICHPDNRNTSLPSAEFYSEALGHNHEYRVHVVCGQVISCGQKYQRQADASPWIRNMKNGWIFLLDVQAPAVVKEMGRQAVVALGLDFGAADIGYKIADNKAWVFEVNSAPTMSQKTAAHYATAFKKESV